MLKLYSPAKINLFLRVLNKRVDGYHNIASLFQAIDLFDIMNFEFSKEDQFSCSDSSLPMNSSNLVIKAINVFRKNTGLKHSLKVHLEKKIPMLAGLGGGSANAATTLWAMNKLHNNPISTEDLIFLAKDIGSDVAFFLSEGTAYCTGRGEKITKVEPLQKKTIWIVWPKSGVSTPDVYKNVNIKETDNTSPEHFLEMFLMGSPKYVNDLELPAFALMPELAQLKQKLLNKGFQTVMLSGSGTCFFCIGSCYPPDDEDLSCFRVSFLNRHPNQWYNEGYKNGNS